jgi:hypothetical protein
MNASILIYAIRIPADVEDGIKKLLNTEFRHVLNQNNVVVMPSKDGIITIEIIKDDISGLDFAQICIDSKTPELVGRAWEVLISLFCGINQPVWISTYTQQYLSQYGKAEDFKLSGTEGVLLDAIGFDRMIS